MLLRIDNVRGQISGDIFAHYAGYFLICKLLSRKALCTSDCLMTFFRLSKLFVLIFSPKLKAQFGRTLTIQR